MSGVQVSGLGVSGPSGTIVSNVSFVIEPGRTLAIVGESGSGKSLTAKAISGLLPAGLTAVGELTLDGHEVWLPGDEKMWRGLRGGTVSLLLQDPFTSLSPVHRCGDQLAWTLRTAAERAGERFGRSAVAAALDEVNLPARVARQYPHELSGGMRQRVAIAAALAARPSLLIADEPTTALDASNQGEVLELLARLRADRQMAMLLVSHDLGLVRGHADDVMVLYAGHVAEQGPASGVLATPTHPYTSGLSGSDLPLAERLERLPAIAGSVPKPGDRPSGCVFHDRCPLAVDRCVTEVPELRPIAVGDLTWHVSCHVTEGPIVAPPPVVVADVDAEPPAALLVASGLRKSFGHHVALDDVGVTVAPHESVGIVGESGSGKTTLARCIAGLETPDAGEVVLDGAVLTAKTRRPDQMQVVFQDPYSSLNPRMRVRDTLREAIGAGTTEYTVEALLELVGLPAGYASKYPSDLSGGERQRVSIARALAPGPRLLICDESVSALDVSVQAQVLNLLSDLRERLGLAILFISHDLTVIRQACDRVYVMKDGRLVEEGFTHRVLLAPQDGYTRTLVAAVPGRTPEGDA